MTARIVGYEVFFLVRLWSETQERIDDCCEVQPGWGCCVVRGAVSENAKRNVNNAPVLSHIRCLPSCLQCTYKYEAKAQLLCFDASKAARMRVSHCHSGGGVPRFSTNAWWENSGVCCTLVASTRLMALVIGILAGMHCLTCQVIPHSLLHIFEVSIFPTTSFSAFVHFSSRASMQNVRPPDPAQPSA